MKQAKILHKKEFEIKITGRGTRQAIINALFNLQKTMQQDKSWSIGEAIAPYYEDPTICVELSTANPQQ